MKHKMNPLLRELAEKASHQSPDGYPVTIPYSDEFVEVFAELLIQECVSHIRKDMDASIIQRLQSIATPG